MKKIIGILGIVLGGLFWMQCSPPDDDVYWNNVELKIKDILKVENQGNYIVGDTLFFELNFSRYLPEEDKSNLLDVYETSGAYEFTYNFGILKYSAFSGIYQGFRIDEEFLVAEKGDVDFSNQISVIFNMETNIYESRIGIVLAEEGEYQLNFDYLNLISAYNSYNPSVNIEHTVTASNPLLLNFTVSQ